VDGAGRVGQRCRVDLFEDQVKIDSDLLDLRNASGKGLQLRGHRATPDRQLTVKL
jgi:hypothetical protein